MSKITNKPEPKSKDEVLKVIRELKKWTKGRNVNKDSLRGYLNNLRRVIASNMSNPLFDNPYIVRPHHAENWKLGYKGIQRLYKFPNGYGASVVRFGREDLKTRTFEHFSYTKNDNEWELAVVKWEGEGFKLVYSTTVTDDVVGYLSENEVEEYLEKIKDLKFFTETHNGTTPKSSIKSWERGFDKLWKKLFLSGWSSKQSYERMVFKEFIRSLITQAREEAVVEERERIKALIPKKLLTKTVYGDEALDLDEVYDKISEPERVCLSPEHNPPNYIVLEPGTYEYVCPVCGKKVTFTVPLITY